MAESGPEPLGEILSRLFIARGWGRSQERVRLDRAWVSAAGEEIAKQTRIENHRRGVVEVAVEGSILYQELVQFHKRRLLEAMKRELKGTPIRDLKFRLMG